MKRIGFYFSLFLTALFCLPLSPALAQQVQNGWFDFVLPWDDATPGTITDVSFLNSKPAGKNGKIVVRDHRFVESKTGKRIRFLATNLTAWQNFPDKDVAVKVAARMSKFGINLVRLHHMDNIWNLNSGSSIWMKNNDGALLIDPDKLDRLDYLIAQLKKQGIYVNINLKVSKVVSQADGFPESIKQLKIKYHKRVDKFAADMIEHQKQYARDLLTHVNPYTGLAYTDDPAVLVVEINNENGLLGVTWGAVGEKLNELPQPYLGELQAHWNHWLNQQYQSDNQLETAWSIQQEAQKTPVFPVNSKWVCRPQGQAKAKLKFPNGQAKGPKSQIHFQIQKHTGKSFHIEAHLNNIDIRESQIYVLKFKAKAAAQRSIAVSVMRSRGDYRSVGILKTVKLTGDWKQFEYTFNSKKTDPGHMRLTFKVGQHAADVWIKEVQMTPSAGQMGLQEGESLAKNNIHVPQTMTPTQHRDWISFLVDLEIRYGKLMRGFLKNELGVKALVIDTQANWGGLAGYASQIKMDYVDIHAYWQHPHFPGKSWDRSNWRIDNSSLVNAWAKGEKGTLDRLARARVIGMPYSVSEYDHSAPSEYAAECMPLFSTVAATQDWDAIYSFEYGSIVNKDHRNRIAGFFDHGSHPAKIAFYPAAAMLFRQGLIPSLQSQRALQMPEKSFEIFNHVDEAWSKTDPDGKPIRYLTAQSGMEFSPQKSVAQPQMQNMTASQKQVAVLQVRSVHGGGIFVTASDHAIVVVGQIGEQKIQAGHLNIDCKKFEKNFAAMTLTAMDQKPITKSKSMLLTVVAQARNKNMKWNDAHTSVSQNWGKSPTQVLGVPADLSIKMDRKLKVFTLDGKGQRVKQIRTQYENGKLKFSISSKDQTLWYELTD